MLFLSRYVQSNNVTGNVKISLVNNVFWCRHNRGARGKELPSHVSARFDKWLQRFRRARGEKRAPFYARDDGKSINIYFVFNWTRQSPGAAAESVRSTRSTASRYTATRIKFGSVRNIFVRLFRRGKRKTTKDRTKSSVKTIYNGRGLCKTRVVRCSSSTDEYSR